MAETITYDAATDTSKCYLPYADISTFDPILVVAGDASTDDSGFTIKALLNTLYKIEGDPTINLKINDQKINNSLHIAAFYFYIYNF